MSNAAVTIIVAAMAAAERRVIDHFRDQGATNAAAALTLDPHRAFDKHAVRRLIRRGALVEGAPGRYFLNEAVLTQSKASRRVLLITVMIALLLGLIILLMLQR